MAVIYDYEEEVLEGEVISEDITDAMVKSYQQQLEGNRITNLTPMRRQQEFVGAYMSSGWAYSCASLISISMAANKFGIYNGTKKLDAHPLTKLLRFPNPLMTGVDLAEMTSLFVELAGEAFWVLERSPLGIPVEVYPVMPWFVQIITNPSTGLIANYEVRGANGQLVKIPAQDMIHYKAGNPLNLYRGMSTVQAAAAAIDLEKYAETYNMKFFENSAIPFGVLQSDSFIDPTTARYLEKKFGKGHKGVNQSQKVALLQGNIKYQPLGISQRDAEYLELRKFNRDQILSIFGIPKACIGLVEDVNRANAETGEYVLARWVIRGRLARMEARINQYLMPQYDERLEFRFDDPVPEDEDRYIAKFDSGAAKGIITIDEYRTAVLKLEPLPNGEGNVLLIPAQVLPTDPADIVPEVAPATPPPPVPPAPPDVAPAASVHQHVHQKRTPQGSAGALRYAQSHYRVLVPKFRKRMKGLYKAQGEKVVAALASQKGITKVSGDPLIEIVESDSDYIEKAILPYYPSAYEAGTKLAPEVFGIAIDFSLDHPEAIAALKRMPNKFAKDITETTVTQIRDQVATGMSLGEGIPEITSRIQDLYSTAQGWRAEVAARTETAAAFGQGSLDSWNASDVVVGKSWLWGGDEVDCPSGVCEENEAAGVIPLDEDFPSGDPCEPAHGCCTCCTCPETELP
jgi:HK97 family phage portal protein